MKKLILLAFTAIFSLSANSQSLQITMADTIVGLNSNSGMEFGAYVKVKNISTTDKNVKVEKINYSTNTCAFDSSYFCWDLCYDASATGSFGYQTIGANQISSAFSAYAYAKTNGSSCVDSIGYKFFIDGNPSDFVLINIIFESSATFSVKEIRVTQSKVYPNPANSFFYVELQDMPKAGTRLDMFNLVGAKVQSLSLQGLRTEIPVSQLPSGMYLYSIMVDGKAVDTRKINVKH